MIVQYADCDLGWVRSRMLIVSMCLRAGKCGRVGRMGNWWPWGGCIS